MASEKLEYVKQHIGSESQLKSFFESNTLNHKEQQALQWAYDELSKDRPNMMFIDDAYRIIHAKTTKAVAEEEDESVLEAGEESENKKFCSNCGNEIEAGAKFCSKCGNAVVAQPSSDIQDNSQNRNVPLLKSTKLWTILSIVLIILGLALSVSDYKDYDRDMNTYTRYAQDEFGATGKGANDIAIAMKDLQDDINGGANNAKAITGILLLFVGIGIFTFQWRVPSSEAEKYEREQNIKLAPATRRVLAYLIDIILLLIAGSIVEVMHLPKTIDFLLGYAVLFFYFAYMVYMLSNDTNNGQTIGLKVMKLRVMKENRRPLTKKEGLLYVLFLFVLPPLILVQLGGFLGSLAFYLLPMIYFFNRKRKLIQNFITQTVVVSIVPKELRG